MPLLVERRGGRLTVWLHLGAHGFYEGRRVNCNRAPAPTVVASGFGSFSYWLEDDAVLDPSEASESKPSYRVPSMHEIAALPSNGLCVASTFSGCGGSSLGYKMAGCRVVWANEFIPEAQATYRANHPRTILDPRDIRLITPEDFFEVTGLEAGELDILDGSPPCASFSTAGKREAGWGKAKTYSDTVQRTDDLFFEYVRLLRGIRPKVFVAENVYGLVKGTAKGYFLEILAALKASGYRVEARVCDAQWLGVPQMRQRLIFVGVRDDLRCAPVFPKPLPYRYSVRDAIPWIVRQMSAAPYGESGWQDAATHPSQTIGASPNTGNGRSPPSIIEARIVGGPGAPYSGKSLERSIEDPCPTVVGGQGGRGSHQFYIETASDLTGYAVGVELDKLKPGEQSDRYFQLSRAPLDGPSPTITARGAAAGIAGVAHPIERRKFSIAELRRICSFPDDFVLTGSYAQQWERLGRAVPPVMMMHIAAAIRDGIFRKG